MLAAGAQIIFGPARAPTGACFNALLPDDTGRTFFRGSIDDSRNWQTLCARLEEPDRQIDQMVAGARHGFETFAQLLMPDSETLAV